MPPASRITDLHVCRIPGHFGGAVSKACTSVLVGYLPQARIGDEARCRKDEVYIVTGEPTVLVGYQPAARIGDLTNHASVLVTGCPTVLIGSSAQLQVLFAAAELGLPFCEQCSAGALSEPSGGEP